MIRFVLLPLFVVLIGLGIFIQLSPEQVGFQAFEEGNYDIALEELTPMAEEGQDEAQYLLGQIYEQGLGVAKDPEQAHKWYQLAADQEHETARQKLADLDSAVALLPEANSPLLNNQKASNETQEASNSLEAVSGSKGNKSPAENEDPDLLPEFQLGLNIFLNGDKEKGLKILSPLAEGGHPSAQFTMGQILLEEGIDTGDVKPAFRWFKLSAEQGYAQSQFNLGIMYENGVGVLTDLKRAVKYYKLAADQGHEEAQEGVDRIGEIEPDLKTRTSELNDQDLDIAYENYLKAFRVGDYDTALKLLRPLLAANHAKSKLSLGIMYRMGFGVPKDMKKAAKWIGFSAEQGDDTAQFLLGNMYATGKGVEQNDYIAAKWIKLSAEQGDASVQNLLGSLYEKGIGLPKDVVAAKKWYKLAADQGHKEAIEALALLVEQEENKDDLTQPYQQATKLLFETREYGAALDALLPLAEQGHVLAQYNVGVLYRDGLGTKQNYKTAIKWFRLAADQNDANAQFNLGTMYRQGDGVEQDYETAAEFFQLSAAQGHASGQHMLGLLYDHGMGMPQDYTEALKWYRLSAEQESPYAQFALGQLYRDGLGVPKSRSKAIAFFQLAVDQGDDEAKKQLALLSASYSSDDQDVTTDPALGSHAIEQGQDAFENGDYLEAMEQLYPLAEDGSAEAQFILGQMHRKGLGVDKNGQAALKWTELAAAQGHRDAQYNMGLIHHFGFGMAKDLQKAETWYKKAADQGHEGAKENLSRLNARASKSISDIEVVSIPKPTQKPDVIPTKRPSRKIPLKEAIVETYKKGNYEKTYSLTLPKAKKGDPAAQYLIGDLHARGQGVAKDDVLALEWYLRSAEQGFVKAQLKLSLLYFAGKKVPKDFSKAYKWGLQAAVKGNPEAQYILGVLKEYGKGTTKDLKSAVKWFKLAAAQGDVPAQNYLGLILMGSEDTLLEGMMWLSLASEQGDKEAIEYWNTFTPRMPEQDLVKVREMARNCQAQNYQGC